MDTAATFLQDLAQRGYKKTRVRAAIISRLAALRKPADAASLGSFLEKSGLKVNKTTVYRELAFLLEQAVISEITFGDNKKRYEVAGLPHHHHLVCSACGAVQDVLAERDLAALEKKIERQTDFAITSHSLEFFGLCRRCRP